MQRRLTSECKMSSTSFESAFSGAVDIAEAGSRPVATEDPSPAGMPLGVSLAMIVKVLERARVCVWRAGSRFLETIKTKCAFAYGRAQRNKDRLPHEYKALAPRASCLEPATPAPPQPCASVSLGIVGKAPAYTSLLQQISNSVINHQH